MTESIKAETSSKRAAAHASHNLQAPAVSNDQGEIRIKHSYCA